MFLQSGKYYHIYNHANGFEKIFRNESNCHFFLEKYTFHLSVFIDTYAYCLMSNHFHFLIRVKSREEILSGLKKILDVGEFSTPPASQTLPKFQTSVKSLQPEELREKQIVQIPDFFQAAKMSASSRFKAYEKITKKYLTLIEILKSAKSSSEADAFIEHWISRQFGDLFSSYTQAFNKQNNRMGGLFIKNFQRKDVTSDEYLRTLVVYIHNNPVHHGFVNKPEEWLFSSYSEILNGRTQFIDLISVLRWFENPENFIVCHRNTPDIADYSLE